MILKRICTGHIRLAHLKRLNEGIDLNLTNWERFDPLFKNKKCKEHSDKWFALTFSQPNPTKWIKRANAFLNKRSTFGK